MSAAEGGAPVDPNEPFAKAVLAAYGLAPDAALTLLNVSENATYAVDAQDGRSVLRVHRPGYHSRAAIESELAWVAALREGSVVSTPAVLPTSDGSPVAVARAGGEERHVVRFAWVEGVEPHGETLVDDFGLLGAVTARLHEHARRWPRPAGFTRFTWDLETSLGEKGHWGRWRDGMAVGPAEAEVLGRCADRICLRLNAFGGGPDRFGLVHADLRTANLLVSDDGTHASGRTVHVIDFDDCGFGWYLYDLGSSLSFMEHDPAVPELTAAWVEGYRSVAPLSAREEAELATFVMLRRLLLVAWIGSHADTDLARSMGEEFTAVSCDLAETFLSRP